MAKAKTITVKVAIPDVQDFASKYPHYITHAKGTGKYLFDLIMKSSSFISAVCATVDLDLPAVAGIAKQCDEAAKRNSPKQKLANFDKQFIGAAMCTLMEFNGFKKTSVKNAIPHKAFTKGEVYEATSWKGF